MYMRAPVRYRHAQPAAALGRRPVSVTLKTRVTCNANLDMTRTGFQCHSTTSPGPGHSFGRSQHHHPTLPMTCTRPDHLSVCPDVTVSVRARVPPSLDKGACAKYMRRTGLRNPRHVALPHHRWGDGEPVVTGVTCARGRSVQQVESNATLDDLTFLVITGRGHLKRARCVRRRGRRMRIVRDIFAISF